MLLCLRNIYRKAAIPIPYIIALIIGIVVVAVLGYWLIFSAGRGGSVVTSAECKARMLAFCLEQQAGLGKWEEKDRQVCGGLDLNDKTTKDKECPKLVKQ